MTDPGAIVVTALTTSPVKGMRAVAETQVALEAGGVADDRRFYLVDERGWLVNGKHVVTLNSVVADYRHADRALTLTLPGGGSVGGTVELGEEIATRFFSRPATARLVVGDWSDALGEHFGRTLRLVESVDRTATDRGRGGAVSLVSRASVAGLADVAGEDVDPRRFRMLVEIDGVEAHEEDAWIGSPMRVGTALVRFNGHVGRCAVTTRDPDTGVADLPTLDLLRSYRGELDTTEPLAFGVYGEVLAGGLVAVGDFVSPA